MQRMERLLCQLESQSPILSDAEVGMEQELSQLLPRLEAINSRIHEVCVYTGGLKVPKSYL